MALRYRQLDGRQMHFSYGELQRVWCSAIKSWACRTEWSSACKKGSAWSKLKYRTPRERYLGWPAHSKVFIQVHFNARDTNLVATIPLNSNEAKWLHTCRCALLQYVQVVLLHILCRLNGLMASVGMIVSSSFSAVCYRRFFQDVAES